MTKVWVRTVTTPGEDVYQLLLVWPPGTRMYVQDFANHAIFNRFEVTADPIDKGSYVEYSVRWISSSGAALVAGQRIALVLNTPAEEHPAIDFWYEAQAAGNVSFVALCEANNILFGLSAEGAVYQAMVGGPAHGWKRIDMSELK